MSRPPVLWNLLASIMVFWPLVQWENHLGLIFTDIFAIIFELPIAILSTLSCRWFLKSVGCTIEALSAFFTGSSNLYIFVLISIDRFLLIRYPHSRKLFTVRRAYLGVASSYLFALFWAVLPLFGWSYYDFEGTGASCSVKWQKKSLLITSYLITIFFGVFLFPMIMMAVVNWKIFRCIKELCSKRFMTATADHFRLRRQYRVQHRVTGTILMVIAGFLICWFPYAIMIFIGGFINSNLVPPLLTTIVSLFSKTSFVSNSFIYVMRNNSLRPHFFSFRRQSHRPLEPLPAPINQPESFSLCQWCYMLYRMILNRPFRRLYISLSLDPSSIMEMDGMTLKSNDIHRNHSH